MACRIMAEARRKHEAECERIRRENARVAQLHTQEVEERMFKEEQYKLVGTARTWMGDAHGWAMQ